MKVPVFYDGGDQTKFQDELNQNMRANLSDEGWVTPSQPTANITALSPNMPNGTFWYDTDTNEMKVNIAGVVKVFQVV